MNLLSFAPRPSHVFFELAARCAPDLWGSNGSPSHPLHRSAVYCADRPRAGFPLELCSKNIFDKSQLHRVVYCFLLRCLSDPLRIQKWAFLCVFSVSAATFWFRPCWYAIRKGARSSVSEWILGPVPSFAGCQILVFLAKPTIARWPHPIVK